jgi:methyltransferase (TIGR00027 family)
MKPGHPSATALLVASGVAFQASHPEHGHLVPREAAELTRRMLVAAGRRERSGSSAITRRLVGLQERLTVPGLTLHYVLRKKAIEDLVRDAIVAGYRQLVVLGGGFDTLALRLADQVTAIELDHPETQRVKRAAAFEHDRVEFVELDLSRGNLTDALERSQRYRDDEPAVVLIEAVFMYLWEADVRGIFKHLAKRHAPTRVIFTFMEREHFVHASAIAKWWLERAGEPSRWCMHPDQTKGFLEHHGFTMLELLLDVRYQHGFDAALGEHIAVADRA